MAMKMHDRDNENLGLSNLVDHAVRETVRKTSPGSARKLVPSCWIPQNAIDCAEDFVSKLKA